MIFCEVVNGGDLGVCDEPEVDEGFNFEPVGGGTARGREESLGVVGRRPLMVYGDV